jgi:hypothetical protein
MINPATANGESLVGMAEEEKKKRNTILSTVLQCPPQGQLAIRHIILEN